MPDVARPGQRACAAGLALPPRLPGMDLLLLDWLDRHYDGSTAAQRARFEAVLELADPELERYLLQAEHPLEAELPSAARREPLAATDALSRP